MSNCSILQLVLDGGAEARSIRYLSLMILKNSSSHLLNDGGYAFRERQTLITNK